MSARKYQIAVLVMLMACFTLADMSGCVRLRNPSEVNAPARLSEIATAAAVTDDGRPLNTVSIFIASTPSIYVTAKVNDAPPGTSISAEWYYVKDSTGREVNQFLFSDSDTVSGSRYVYFEHSAPGFEWEKGQYSVALYIDGNEVTDAIFTVRDVQQAGLPAPTITFFKAEPMAISYGQSVTLSWQVSGADKIQVTPSVGTVQAAGNTIVKPAATTEYTLTATNSSGTTDKKVTIKVTSFSSNKPELVISDFWVEGDTAWYKIANIGGQEANESLTGIYIHGMAAGQSKVDILAPGQERSYAVPVLVWTYGSQRSYSVPVRVCADDYNRVSEYDENNNCLTLDW